MFDIKKNFPYLAVSLQNEKQLNAVLDCGFVQRIYLDANALSRDSALEGWSDVANRVHRAGKTLYYVMPAVLRGDSIAWHEAHLIALREAGIDGFVTGSYEGLGLLRQTAPLGRILADSSLYMWNSQSREAFRQAGVDEITLPLELNEQELGRRGYMGGELLLYGYLPLMVSAQCVVKNTAGCKKQSGFLRLKDRYGKYFTVQNVCTDCYNVIYNTSPLWLFRYFNNWKASDQKERGKGRSAKGPDRLGASGYRLSFTTEAPGQIRRVLSCYERVFIRGEAPDPDWVPGDYTNGHLKRGVE